MRARNRSIEVFSVSTLDVFCGAMGAFLIIMLSLLGQAQASSASGAAQPSAQEVEELQKRLAEAEQYQQIVTVVVFWDEAADVDLAVDYEGGWSGSKPGLLQGERAFAIRDERGAGFETFAQTVTGPDVWGVHVKLSSAPPPGGVVVRGTATITLRATEGGRSVRTWTFGPQRLTRRGELRSLLGFAMQEDGSLVTLPGDTAPR